MRVLEEQEVRHRKNRLLQSVILEFIRTGHPVASSVIAGIEDIKLSSATVRNLLHDLEQEGYLSHPHTSAGRMPTDKGYRYYVDYLINLQEILVEEQKNIDEQYSRRVQEIESLLANTSRMLAGLSHYAGFVLRPKLDANDLRRVDFIPVAQDKALMVLVATNGFIRYKLVALPKGFNLRDLSVFSQWINKKFHGKNLREFCLEFTAACDEERLKESSRLEEMARLVDEPLQDMGREIKDEELLLEGAAQILTSQELDASSRTIRDLMTFLDNRERLTLTLKKELDRYQDKMSQNVAVVIGGEAADPRLQELSLVAKTFETAQNTVGLLGILGPKRMEYGQMMALVENVQTALQKALNLWAGQKEI